MNEEVKEILEKHKNKKGPLMPILQDIQNKYGYLSNQSLKTISDELNISLEEIYSVATFYNQFKFSPKGKHEISLCLGTVCYVKGADLILNEITRLLGIKNGECTKDGKFSLDTTRCLGCCGMAPVLKIDENIYGNVKVTDIKKILDSYE